MGNYHATFGKGYTLVIKGFYFHPVIGGPLVELLRGGVGVGQATLTRFYSLHTFVLPLLTAVFMLMHFLMIRKQGISGPL